MSPGARLRGLMAQHPCLVTPGCWDASARVAQHVGFEALAIGGFGVEAALLGALDVDLLTLTELIDQASGSPRRSKFRSPATAKPASAASTISPGG